jgi:2-polyprenyl-3-methyl-5-hydroxy-6-metoxy-1,4-benzoquinol methylase
MTKRDAKLESEWERLARHDPLWSACTGGKRHITWQLDEFLATGAREVCWATGLAKETSIYPRSQSLAVDFGCGPGRLTGAMADSFAKVIGVDTSQTMVDIARRTHPRESVSFCKSTTELKAGCADLIYSTFVLQHLSRKRTDACLREFSRLLSSDGLLIFQYPAKPRRTPRGLAFALLSSLLVNAIQRHLLRYPGIMPMSWMSSDRMSRRIAAAGLTVLDYRTGPRYNTTWEDVWYFVRQDNVAGR